MQQEPVSKAFRPVRVVWTQAEKEEIVVAAWDLIRAEPGLEPVAALQDAQMKVFTAERRNRRRPINRMADVADWFPSLLRNYAKRNALYIPAEFDVQLPPEVPAGPPVVGRIEPPGEPLMGLSDQPDSALYAEIGRRLAASVQTAPDLTAEVQRLAETLVRVERVRVDEQTAGLELMRKLNARVDELEKRIGEGESFSLALADEVAALRPPPEPTPEPTPAEVTTAAAEVAAAVAPVVPHTPPAKQDAGKQVRLPRVFVPSLTDTQLSDFEKRFAGRAVILTARKHGGRVGAIPDADHYVVQVRFAGTDYLRSIKDHVGKAGQGRVVSVAGGLSSLFLAVHEVVEKHHAK
jgi:hypothetical protein